MCDQRHFFSSSTVDLESLNVLSDLEEKNSSGLSQRFWPLQSMLHWAMIRATCLATPLRDKTHELFHSVTAPLVLATLWRNKLHETFHSVTYPATAKIVARQVARKVEPNSTSGNGSCNLFLVFIRHSIRSTIRVLSQHLSFAIFHYFKRWTSPLELILTALTPIPVK